MPFIPAVLLWIVNFVSTWAVNFFGKKIVTAGVSIGAFISLTFLFVICIKQIANDILMTFVGTLWLIKFMGWFIPNTFVAILGAIISAHACRWAYDIAVYKINLLNSST